jgi:dTDP-4-amino-4,6-dideoxygalactose transaminase
MSQRRVPFLDLRVTNDSERQEIIDALNAILDHGKIVLGPEVEQFETNFARYCGRQRAIGVNSGTDALALALRALRIGPGDEVITTSLSWIATANAIAAAGSTPVFADIRDDLNVDPASVAALVTPRTKVILPVHYTGKVCDMTALRRIADEHRLAIVEDASQAFSARHQGMVAGSLGSLGAFSLNPMKVFAAIGEAGCIVTDDEDFRERLECLRYNGCVNRETCIEPSLNGRIDTIQAAVLLKRLPRVAALVEKRRANAALYDRLLPAAVQKPVEHPGDYDVYYTYTIRAPRRDELKAFLERKGVETRIQHPLLMPEQPAYANGARGSWPNAKRLVGLVLCLPVHEKLRAGDIEYVSEAITEFYSLS